MSEFCDTFHADINSVVNAEEIKAKNQVNNASTAPTPSSTTRRGRPRKQPDLAEPFNLEMLQGKGMEEQLRFLQQWQSQLDAYASQLKVAK